MYKVTYPSNDEYKEHERIWGNINQLPSNFREVTEAEFAKTNYQSFHCLRKVELRYFYTPQFNGLAVHCFFLDDNVGWAMHNDWQKQKVRYFLFGLCEHEDVEIANPRMFEHIYQCKKCGRKYSVDSSG
jgi:hypothetical protein